MTEEVPKASPLSSEDPDGGRVAMSPQAPPVNKIHEWAAAALLVVLLTLILAGFVYVMRGASI